MNELGKSTKTNSLNRVYLREAVNKLLNLNHSEFDKLKILKILEGKIAAINYDELQQQMSYFSQQLTSWKQRLLQASENRMRRESIQELRGELEQRDRIIVHLVNILRNLDDKILYAKSNKPVKSYECEYYQCQNSPKKYEHSWCTYHSLSYNSVMNSPRYKNKSKEYEEQYEAFVPSEEELKNLVHESIYYKIRKVNIDSFEIDRVGFKFIRDSRGDTYAQTSTEVRPLYQFLDRFKGVVHVRPRYASPEIFRSWPRCVFHY